jgi:hypothetical protein
VPHKLQHRTSDCAHQQEDYAANKGAFEHAKGQTAQMIGRIAFIFMAMRVRNGRPTRTDTDENKNQDARK